MAIGVGLPADMQMDTSAPGPGKSYVPGMGWVYGGQQVPNTTTGSMSASYPMENQVSAPAQSASPALGGIAIPTPTVNLNNISGGATQGYAPHIAPTQRPQIPQFQSVGSGGAGQPPVNTGASFGQAFAPAHGGGGPKAGQGGGIPSPQSAPKPGQGTGLPAPTGQPAINSSPMTSSPLSSAFGGQTSGGGPLSGA